jgi:hypothetical protein
LRREAGPNLYMAEAFAADRLTRARRLEEMDDVSTQVRPELINRLMDVYVDWREECAAVRDAYVRWSSAAATDRTLAFAAYRAALDREESAARIYGDHLDRVAPNAPPRAEGGDEHDLQMTAPATR